MYAIPCSDNYLPNTVPLDFFSTFLVAVQDTLPDNLQVSFALYLFIFLLNIY